MGHTDRQVKKYLSAREEALRSLSSDPEMAECAGAEVRHEIRLPRVPKNQARVDEEGRSRRADDRLRLPPATGSAVEEWRNALPKMVTAAIWGVVGAESIREDALLSHRKKHVVLPKPEPPSTSGRGHHVGADSEPLLEDDDRPGVTPVSNPTPFVVAAEAFLGLTNQVQALAGMVQTIVPDLPQLIHSVVEVHVDSLAAAPARSRSRSRDPVQASPDLDTLSSDSVDSVREQIRHVHQRLYEV
ncbi:hypothetical protein B296_00011414 [Ensete ventricosum]|uniref:Uncharacterized protein n=1 Tax=Ensete ventricosum TaxID=4639 RepID=A0A427AUZ4_ENSVE|nr:hypothetical protein B296_00011414 [Ensete ventricosum]